MIEVGMIITSSPTNTSNFTVNGIIQENKLTLQQQFMGDTIVTDYEGYFESNTLIKGTYKSNRIDEFDESGTFELNIRPQSA